MSKEQTPIEELLGIYNERRYQIVNNPHIKPFVLTAKLKELDKCISAAEHLLAKEKTLVNKLRSALCKNESIGAYSISMDSVRNYLYLIEEALAKEKEQIEEMVNVNRDILNWLKSELSQEENTKLGKTQTAYRIEKVRFLRSAIDKIEATTK